MANKQLFASTRGQLLPVPTAINRAAAPAYAYPAKQMLAQYATTGCLANTFYAGADEQLSTVLELCRELDATFVARTAVYARKQSSMKDMPALLLAVLSMKSNDVLKRVFPQVIDNGRMLRNFVQIIRSGAVGRKSLGSASKTLVQQWLNRASERKLVDAIVGQDPSLADVVRMVHPKPADPTREALFGWMLGRPHATEVLPEAVKALLRFRVDRSAPIPNVPFQLLTACGLTRGEWAQLARQAGWHMLRMNLNTFARHGVFEMEGMAEVAAARLRDWSAIAQARVLPYQLMVAYRSAGPEVPEIVKDALEEAMEVALRNIERCEGAVVVCPDVSGSMMSPVTGNSGRRSTVVRCIDVAALVSAAILRNHPKSLVLPFETTVREVEMHAGDSVMANAAKLSAMGGGGTNCSAPLAWLVRCDVKADLVILVSDNQSWVDARAAGGTETMRQWALFKARNPRAKLVCVDVQPYGTTQAVDREDVLNVGGFSDEVFDVVARFSKGELAGSLWVDLIEGVEL